MQYPPLRVGRGWVAAMDFGWWVGNAEEKMHPA